MELTNGQFGQFFGGFIYPEKGINQEAAKVSTEINAPQCPVFILCVFKVLPGIHVLAAQINKMTVK
jgi:hypothetical protein